MSGLMIRVLTPVPALALAAGITACSETPPSRPADAPAPAPAAQSVTTRPAAAPAGDVAWHYEGEHGPSGWGKLSPHYAVCGTGRAQSPIDISAPRQVSDTESLKTHFAPVSLKIVHHEHMADAINNGHTIQVNYSEGDALTVGATSYQLAQYHFHAPSEHTLDGKHFPMEMHLVHKTLDGRLAVIGVFIAEGAHNAAFDPIWANLPTQKGQESHFAHVQVDVDALLPPALTTYRYDGSLTTPPCSEGVQWFVMTTPIELSAAQIGRFRAIVRDNNRPVQPLQGRSVVTDAIEGKQD